jgi:hypothetical protein
MRRRVAERRFDRWAQLAEAFQEGKQLRLGLARRLRKSVRRDNRTLL